MLIKRKVLLATCLCGTLLLACAATKLEPDPEHATERHWGYGATDGPEHRAELASHRHHNNNRPVQPLGDRELVLTQN
jgi:carbonic anhydrase